MEKIIITGAAGFIGTNLARYFSENYEVILVDKLSNDDRWKNLVGIDVADYLDADLFINKLDAIKNIHTVIHMGACSSTTEQDARYLINNNYEYSKQLFQWCSKVSANFIYASSAATYGSGSHGYDDNESLITNLKPLNAYGLSKHMFDMWQMKQEDRPPQVVGLKFFNVYGPYENHKGSMASVALHAYHQIKEDKVVRLFKSYNSMYEHGEQKRDFIYVKDVVETVNFFLKNQNNEGIYNVGTGKARTFNDLAYSVFNALSLNPKIDFIPMPDGLIEKYQYFTEANIDKLRNIGYQYPFTTLEDGVREYIEFLNNME